LEVSLVYLDLKNRVGSFCFCFIFQFYCLLTSVLKNKSERNKRENLKELHRVFKSYTAKFEKKNYVKLSTTCKYELENKKRW